MVVLGAGTAVAVSQLDAVNKWFGMQTASVMAGEMSRAQSPVGEGEECTHANLKHVVLSEANCVAQGFDYYECEDCGKWFEDANASNTSWPFHAYKPALGHDWGEDGVCKRCNEKLQTLSFTTDLTPTEGAKYVLAIRMNGEYYAITPIPRYTSGSPFEYKVVKLAVDEYGALSCDNSEALFFDAPDLNHRLGTLVLGKDYNYARFVNPTGDTDYWNQSFSINEGRLTAFDTDMSKKYYMHVSTSYNSATYSYDIVSSIWASDYADTSDGTTYMFLRSYEPCHHEHVKPIAGVPATCTAAGLIDHFKCEDCGKNYFMDGETRVYFDENNYNHWKKVLIKATDHKWEGRECTRCHEKRTDYVFSEDLDAGDGPYALVGIDKNNKTAVPVLDNYGYRSFLPTYYVTMREDGTFEYSNYHQIVLFDDPTLVNGKNRLSIRRTDDYSSSVVPFIVGQDSEGIKWPTDWKFDRINGQLSIEFEGSIYQMYTNYGSFYVTNSESNLSYYSPFTFKLMRAISSCDHSTMIEHPGIEPTCMTAGVLTSYECAQCHKVFSDADGLNLMSNPIVLPTGHSIEGDQCTRCDYHVENLSIVDETKGNGEYLLIANSNGNIGTPILPPNDTSIRPSSLVFDEDGTVSFSHPFLILFPTKSISEGNMRFAIYRKSATELGLTVVGADSDEHQWHTSWTLDSEGHYSTEFEGNTYYLLFNQNEYFVGTAEQLAIFPTTFSFMRVCHHNMVDDPGRQPTCEEGGIEPHYFCNDCGKHFSDAEGGKPLFDLVTIPANGHEWKSDGTCRNCDETRPEFDGTDLTFTLSLGDGGYYGYYYGGIEATCTGTYGKVEESLNTDFRGEFYWNSARYEEVEYFGKTGVKAYFVNNNGGYLDSPRQKQGAGNSGKKKAYAYDIEPDDPGYGYVAFSFQGNVSENSCFKDATISFDAIALGDHPQKVRFGVMSCGTSRMLDQEVLLTPYSDTMTEWPHYEVNLGDIDVNTNDGFSFFLEAEANTESQIVLQNIGFKTSAKYLETDPMINGLTRLETYMPLKTYTSYNYATPSAENLTPVQRVDTRNKIRNYSIETYIYTDSYFNSEEDDEEYHEYNATPITLFGKEGAIWQEVVNDNDDYLEAPATPTTPAMAGKAGDSTTVAKAPLKGKALGKALRKVAKSPEVDNFWQTYDGQYMGSLEVDLRANYTYFNENYKLTFDAISVGNEALPVVVTFIDRSTEVWLEKIVNTTLASSASDWQHYEVAIDHDFMRRYEGQDIYIEFPILSNSTVALRNVRITSDLDQIENEQYVTLRSDASRLISDINSFVAAVNADHPELTQFMADLTDGCNLTSQKIDAVTSIRDNEHLALLSEQFDILVDLYDLSTSAYEKYSNKVALVEEYETTIVPYTQDATFKDAVAAARQLADNPSGYTAQQIIDVLDAMSSAYSNLDLNHVSSYRNLMALVAEAEAYAATISDFTGMYGELLVVIDKAPIDGNSTSSQMNNYCTSLRDKLTNVKKCIGKYEKMEYDVNNSVDYLANPIDEKLAEYYAEFPSLNKATMTTEQVDDLYCRLHGEYLIYNNRQTKLDDFKFYDGTSVRVGDRDYTFNYDKNNGVAAIYLGYVGSGTIENLEIPSVITVDGEPYAVISIRGSSSSYQSAIQDITMPKGLRQLESYSLYALENVSELHLPPYLEKIGSYVFPDHYGKLIRIFMESKEVPVMSSTVIGFGNSSLIFHVPAENFATYCDTPLQASNSCIVAGIDGNIFSVKADRPGTLLTKIVDTVGSLSAVNTLVVEGTVSVTDIEGVIDRVHNLINFDMSKANINLVDGTLSLDSKARFLQRLSLPAGIKRIEKIAAANLSDLVVPEGVTYIGNLVTKSLQSVTLPNSVEKIGDYCFESNNKLLISSLPESLKTIGSYAFTGCQFPENLILPEGLENIGSCAFQSCNTLKTVTLPSTLKTLESMVFMGCNNLTEIISNAAVVPVTKYSFVNTNKGSITVRVPRAYSNTYENNTCWSELGDIVPFDAYPDIYINDVHELNVTQTTADESRPNLVMGNQDIMGYDTRTGRATINSEAEMFSLNSFRMNFSVEPVYEAFKMRYSYSGLLNTKNNNMKRANTLVVDGNMRSDSTIVDFYMYSGQLAPISLPFNASLAEAKRNSGEKLLKVYRHSTVGRADDMLRYSLTWEELSDDDILEAGKGYYLMVSDPFVSSSDRYVCVTFSALNDVHRQSLFNVSDHHFKLEEALSEFPHNRSWNLIGNPYPSFYDIRYLSLDAPIYIRNTYSNTYEVFSTQDDDYMLAPGEAFYIQKPLEEEVLTFDAEGRQLNPLVRESRNNVAKKAKGAQANADRQVFTLGITNAEESQWAQTRLVVNPQAKADYETGRDAIVFAAPDSVLQVYTLYNNIAFAINERPYADEILPLGFNAPEDGAYTLTLDAKNAQAVFFISDAEAGTYTILEPGQSLDIVLRQGSSFGRYFLGVASSTNGIEKIFSNDDDAAGEKTYNIAGQQIKAPQRGINIQKNRKFIK